MKIIVSGSIGFIGAALTLRLLERGDEVIGLDNHNSYYDVSLKEARLSRLLKFANYTHVKCDISDMKLLKNCFIKYKPACVVNLAAQAGVRYSLENPSAYIQSNIVGFSNILECSKNFNVKHLVYASSSSVYGANGNMPFSIHHNVDHPLSLYAATKKSNELMAHTYSSVYGLPTTGLRFFTVYGPWGRPDMALFKFTKSILSGDAIQVYNNGKHKRDFTYIDDIVEGIICVLDRPSFSNSQWDEFKPDPGSSRFPWRVYNIGSSAPVELMYFIKSLEKSIKKKAIINYLPMQVGDVPETYADISDLMKEFDFKPSVEIEVGIDNFVKWYLSYYS